MALLLLGDRAGFHHGNLPVCPAADVVRERLLGTGKVIDHGRHIREENRLVGCLLLLLLLRILLLPRIGGEHPADDELQEIIVRSLQALVPVHVHGADPVNRIPAFGRCSGKLHGDVAVPEPMQQPHEAAVNAEDVPGAERFARPVFERGSPFRVCEVPGDVMRDFVPLILQDENRVTGICFSCLRAEQLPREDRSGSIRS